MVASSRGLVSFVELQMLGMVSHLVVVGMMMAHLMDLRHLDMDLELVDFDHLDMVLVELDLQHLGMVPVMVELGRQHLDMDLVVMDNFLLMMGLMVGMC